MTKKKPTTKKKPPAASAPTPKAKPKKNSATKPIGVVAEPVSDGLNGHTTALDAIIPGSQPLSHRRLEQFCHEYIIDLNASKAALRSQYSKKTAPFIGAENLKKPKAIARISYLMQQSVKRVANTQELEMSADATLRHHMAMAYSNIMDYVSLDDAGQPFMDLGKATRDQTSAISKIKFKQLAPILIPTGNGDVLEREVTEIEISLWDKPGAGRALMKHQGLLKDEPVQVNVAFIDKMMVGLQQELKSRGIDIEGELEDLRAAPVATGKEKAVVKAGKDGKS